jgi:hypothetical protein
MDVRWLSEMHIGWYLVAAQYRLIMESPGSYSKLGQAPHKRARTCSAMITRHGFIIAQSLYSQKLSLGRPLSELAISGEPKEVRSMVPPSQGG